MKKKIKIIYSGLIAGLFSQGILGALFMSPPVQKILYNPNWQSELFLEITPTREIFPSVAGLVVLSIVHSWLFNLLQKSIPGQTWIKKGLFWGFTIWIMYWVFQEWFVYHTLLQEPILLTFVELTILLFGSLIEGLIISKFLFEINKEE
ncbi:hypothetical protein [Sunxiuqinia indica]|uniref:hypothetical protein n=1 Tax=Sunxiuqinia indica TaxID=2692584 RepID=UPI001358B71F|nr:hypothetical protein [Sunxiuqinia indica]